MSLGVGLCQLVKNLWYTVCTSSSRCTSLERSQQLDIRTKLEDSQRSRFIKQLRPLAHAQFATFDSVQRLSPKKGASDKNSLPGDWGSYLMGAPKFCDSAGHKCTQSLLTLACVCYGTMHKNDRKVIHVE